MSFEIWKNGRTKIQESLNLIAEWMQRFLYHIYAYYDSLLPIGSDEILKSLKILLNNPQCGHKLGQKFPIFFGEITIKASPSI